MGKDSIIKYGCVAIGLALIGSSHYLYNNFTNMPKIAVVQDCNVHKENEGKLVMLQGKLTSVSKNTDKELGISSAYPFMQRKVEMYHYEKKDGKVTAVWGDNVKVGSVVKDANGKAYKNPSWPDSYRNQSFYSDFTVNHGNLKLSTKFMEQMLGKGSSQLENTYEKDFKLLNKLPESRTPQGYAFKGNRYLKAVQNGIGSTRIYYRAIKFDENAKEFTILGIQKNGYLVLGKDVDERRFYDRKVSLEELKKTYNHDAPHAAAAAVLFGLFFIVYGLFKAKSV